MRRLYPWRLTAAHVHIDGLAGHWQVAEICDCTSLLLATARNHNTSLDAIHHTALAL